MSEKVYISKSSHGQGVFAKELIVPREHIFYMNGKQIDFEQSISYMGVNAAQKPVR